MRGNLSSELFGSNNVCTLNNDQRPSCKCPPGYSLVDPNNKGGDCKPSIPQICEEGMDNLTNDLPNTYWPMHD